MFLDAKGTLDAEEGREREYDPEHAGRAIGSRHDRLVPCEVENAERQHREHQGREESRPRAEFDREILARDQPSRAERARGLHVKALAGRRSAEAAPANTSAR